MRTDLQDQYSIEAFEASDVDPARFDHEAHVYVAWLYLAGHDRETAIVRFDAALRRLTRKIGATDKYNATITWLFLLLIDERNRDGEDWPTFRVRNTDLFEGRPRQAAA
jgi:hypothetical protein